MSSGSSNDFMIFGLEVTTLPPPFLRNRKNHQNLPKSWSRDQQKRFWGGPQATTKTPKKIFFEKIIFEPQHIQKLSESGQGARKTVQNRQICQKFTNFSQNLQTLPKSNCRTTLVPTVMRRDDTEFRHWHGFVSSGRRAMIFTPSCRENSPLSDAPQWPESLPLMPTKSSIPFSRKCLNA